MQDPVPTPMAPAMALALCASFGSVDHWRQAFVALGEAAAGRAGWLVLSHRPQAGRLVHQWVPDQTDAMAGSTPILALAWPAHQAATSAAADTALQAIDWAGVYQRYQDAVALASADIGAPAGDVGPARLLDVRRDAMFAQSDVLIDGARWHDPAAVDTWADRLPADGPVVVYCVRGHEVSRAVALRLRAAGHDARFLIGGLEAWQAAGLPVVAKPVA